MIGSGLKKLAQQNGMQVAAGVAYGSLRGYATTLSEGSGYKQVVIITRFADPAGQDALHAQMNTRNITADFRVQNMNFAPDGISVIFQDNPGTMKKIEAFIDWFYPMLPQFGATHAGYCGECGTDILDGGCWILRDGVAYHVHEACAQRVEAAVAAENTQKKEEAAGSYGLGILGAFLGAALGAVVWALVLMAGYVASIVGFVIGWLAEKGYTLLKGKQGKGKVVILILAVIFGVLLGTFAADAITLLGMIGDGELVGFTAGDVPAMILVMLLTDSEYMTSTLGNVAMGLLFAGLGVFALLRKAGREVADSKFKRLS